MTMVPHDWRAATQILRTLRWQAREHQEQMAQSIVSFAVPCAFGALAGWVFLPRILAHAGAADTLVAISSGVLAFTAIVSGFVVSLMLQTGRAEPHAALTFEQFQLYTEKLRYLLHSQIATLVACLLLTALLILWCVLLAADANRQAILCMGMLCGGLLSVTMLRMFLLPLQVYDLHDFGLQEALKAKREEVNRNIRDGQG